MKLTIRAKLLIGFTLLLVLSSLIQAFSFSITRDYIFSLITDNQGLEAKKGAIEIQDFFTGINDINYALASEYKEDVLNASGSGNLADFEGISNFTIKNNDEINRIAFLSKTGRELYKFDSHGIYSPDKLSYEVYTDEFKNATNGKTAISKVYFLDQELGPHIDIFSPIFDNNHDVFGVIKMQIKLETLRKNLENIKYGDHGFLYVVDDEGRLITHPSQQYVIARPNLISRKIIAMTLHDKTPSQSDESYVNEKNISVFAKAEKIPGINWVAIVEQPVSDANGFLNFIRNIFIVTLLGSMCVLLLIALFLSENFTRPIRTLQKSAEKIEKGQLSTIEIMRTGDEIESLSLSFSSMINQLLSRESSIKKENQEMTTLLQSLYDAVIGLDANNRIIAFNKAAEKITGLQTNKVIGKHINEVLWLYAGQERMLFDKYKDQSDSVVKRMRDKGLMMTNEKGEHVTISITTSPILLESKQNGYIIAFHDMSKEHELEEMKVDFVSMAAHELRTPLTAIRGYASMIQLQKAQMLDETGKEMLQRLVISSENLSNLIDNLLSVSRIERNAFSVEKKPVKIDTVIFNVIDTLKNQTQTKKQKLTYNVPTDLPIVMADPFRITQVILNLMSNATNYTAEGGEITVNARQKENKIQVSVIDNGQGIPKEAQSKLFTKFFRVSGILEQGSKGTGLGLYISKSIIEMHRGRIWVQSEIGKGSTFTFELPVATDEEINNYQKRVASLSVTSGMGPSIILKK